MSPATLFRNARLILPERVMTGADLLVREGRIAAIGEHLVSSPDTVEIDARGLYLMPGMIDLHTDSLEKEICPRPGANFPIDVALVEFDRKLAGIGITTVYHSMHYGYQADATHRMPVSPEELVRAIRAYGRSEQALTRTRFHLRFEIAGRDDSAGVRALLEEGLVDLLSFMDHTPGQGQYPADRFIARRMQEGRSEAEARALIAERQALPKVGLETLRELAELARARGIVIASHDDCTPAKVRTMHGLGIGISEFPINFDAAREARALDMHNLGGAPNVLRGGSLSGNLDITAALREGLIDALSSDYYPASMLHAAFRLWKDGVMELQQAIALVTDAPARIAGCARQLGALRAGLQADLLMVDLDGQVPRVLMTLVGGRCVSRAGAAPAVPACAGLAREAA